MDRHLISPIVGLALLAVGLSGLPAGRYDSVVAGIAQLSSVRTIVAGVSATVVRLGNICAAMLTRGRI